MCIHSGFERFHITVTFQINQWVIYVENRAAYII